MATKQGSGESCRTLPKSVRHKKILDQAADSPDASLKQIAEEIPSATVDLVENVLDEYGDPANEAVQKPTEEGQTPQEIHEHIPPSDLTDAQRETIEAIFEQPKATQRELGEQLGITASTVSNRVNSIEGFEWKNRQEIVQGMETNNLTGKINQDSMSANDSSSSTTVDQLTKRVTTLEEQIESVSQTKEKDQNFLEPGLMQKVMHACLQSDSITEDEELKLLKQFLQ